MVNEHDSTPLACELNLRRWDVIPGAMVIVSQVSSKCVRRPHLHLSGEPIESQLPPLEALEAASGLHYVESIAESPGPEPSSSRITVGSLCCHSVGQQLLQASLHRSLADQGHKRPYRLRIVHGSSHTVCTGSGPTVRSLLLRRFFGDVATRLQVPLDGPPVIQYRQAPASLVRCSLGAAASRPPISLAAQPH